MGPARVRHEPHNGHFEEIRNSFRVKTYTVHIERCTFPQWDGTDGTNNLAMPTENELNITTTKPIPDPTMGAFVPHINFKRAK
jgi:hypothetical protein